MAGYLSQAVAICRSVPRGQTGRRYVALAPSWKPITAEWPEDEFIKAYWVEVLDKLDPKKVIRDLGEDNFIMLCCEAPGEFCHRRLVAEWFRKNTSVLMEEFMPILGHHAE